MRKGRASSSERHQSSWSGVYSDQEVDRRISPVRWTKSDSGPSQERERRSRARRAMSKEHPSLKGTRRIGRNNWMAFREIQDEVLYMVATLLEIQSQRRYKDTNTMMANEM